MTVSASFGVPSTLVVIPPSFTADDETVAMYQSDMLQRLPPGKALSKEPDSRIGKLLGALAMELARADAFLRGVLAAANPANPGLDYIDAWESTLQLPDPTIASPSTAYVARAAAVAAKLTADRGHSETDALAVAERFGATGLSFVRYAPFDCDSACTDALYGDEWAYYVAITIPSSTAGSAPSELTAALKSLARSHGFIDVIFV